VIYTPLSVVFKTAVPSLVIREEIAVILGISIGIGMLMNALSKFRNKR
jgi:hypothetical protein